MPPLLCERAGQAEAGPCAARVDLDRDAERGDRLLPPSQNGQHARRAGMRLRASASADAGSLPVARQRLLVPAAPGQHGRQSNVRGRAAEPVPKAGRRVDPDAGRRGSANLEPRPHLDRSLVRAGRLGIAAGGGHCMAERPVRGRVVGIDLYGPFELRGRLLVPALLGHGNAAPNVRRHVVGIQDEPAVVLCDGEPAAGALLHEQRMPPEHARRRVRRIDLRRPCVHPVGIRVPVG